MWGDTVAAAAKYGPEVVTMMAIARKGADDAGDVAEAAAKAARASRDTGSWLSDGNPSAAWLWDDALQHATTVDKLDHIFAPKHNLDPLVRQFGSREAVVERMLREVIGRTPMSGVFEIPISIGGQTVVVRGAVVDGLVRLGTAFTP